MVRFFASVRRDSDLYGRPRVTVEQGSRNTTITDLGTDAFGRTRVSVDTDTGLNPLQMLACIPLVGLGVPAVVGSFFGVLVWHWQMNAHYFWAFVLAGLFFTLLVVVWFLPRVLWLPLLAGGALCTFVWAPHLAAGARTATYYQENPGRTAAAQADLAALRSYHWSGICIAGVTPENPGYDPLYYQVSQNPPCSSAAFAAHPQGFGDNPAIIELSHDSWLMLKAHRGTLACPATILPLPGNSPVSSAFFPSADQPVDHPLECRVDNPRGGIPQYAPHTVLAPGGAPLTIRDRFGQDVGTVVVPIP